MIKTWHPDRFAENAPHRLNAEQISRELNLAFDTIREYYAAQSAKKPLRVVRIRKKRRKQSRKTKIAKAVKETVEKVKTGSSSLASCTAFVVRNDFSEILRKKAA
jgi:TATA-binding protein-associated factor Taf7